MIDGADGLPLELPKCASCAKEFEPKTAWQKFCGNACAVRVRMKRYNIKKYQKGEPNG